MRKPAMETRVSIDVDPRAHFVALPHPRTLMVCRVEVEQPKVFEQAIIWIEPGSLPAATVEKIAVDYRFAGATVRVLPRDAEADPVPSSAGAPAAVSGPDGVRQVVAELIAELPEATRAAASEFVERHLSKVGL